MSHNLVGLELDDLTPRQLRQLLRGAARSSLLRGQKEDKSKEEEDDDAASENDDLVDLHEEKKGKSKPPKVTKDDLPKGIDIEDDEDDIQIAKNKKKAKK
jgi:hypothetical protein